MRNLKMLGLAAFALMAMSAMFASTASAQGPGVLTAGDTVGPVHTETPIHAKQYGAITDNIFEAFGDNLHCTNATSTFTGKASGTDSEIVITPNYKDCFKVNSDHSEGLPITVKTNGCQFIFNQPTSIAGSHTTWEGNVDLVCPGTAAIEVEVFSSGTKTAHSGFRLCRELIASQEGLGPVTYHNIAGEPDDITVEVEATNIKVTKGGLCGSGEISNAAYTSTLTLTSGTPSESGSHDLWFSTAG